MSRILVTGAAGFIGFYLCEKLLQQGHEVYGIDNLNDYYDVNLKNERLARLTQHPNFQFEKISLEQQDALNSIFDKFQPDCVVNLAAQAGVRYSIENPSAYINSNLVGFGNILESCRHHKIGHLIFASSSSVYGANESTPFKTSDNVDHPVSLYAATKKANELMAHSYANLFNLPCTGLRFFTVYGPWGRPDMAYFSFTKAIIEGTPIPVFNNGDMQRDFTYIDDIVQGTMAAIDLGAACKIFNLGNNRPIDLLYLIEQIETSLGKQAIKELLPMQLGEVIETCADIETSRTELNFTPTVTIEDGIHRFVNWYLTYKKRDDRSID
ncbi:MAG TPA: NAD-dependent epimerase/dehydratase family protein [Chlamydiales bacterium]|nr:NAD-dependent epimerase/dehydratase family protein [Chlamydiales bacterium]